MVITGMRSRHDGIPLFPRGSEAVYSKHLLIRAAALVEEVSSSSGGGWKLPTDVPDLVDRGYADDASDLLPGIWMHDAETAGEEWRKTQIHRAKQAEKFLLAGEGQLEAQTLEGLHHLYTADLDDDEAVSAVVRDGNPSIEVVLVRQGEHGYTTLDGHSLGSNGEAISDPAMLEHVVGDSLRLPPIQDLSDTIQRELGPLPAWHGDPWLGKSRALIIDNHGVACVRNWQLTYDPIVGLIVDRLGR